MLTDQDIDKLLSVLASKQEVQNLQKDMDNMKELMQGLLSSVDSLAKAINDLKLEYTGIVHQINRHEAWIKQIADKMGITLTAE